MTSVLSASDPGPSRQATPGTRVLVVEDEQKVAGALREGLEGEGYAVVARSESINPSTACSDGPSMSSDPQAPK